MELGTQQVADYDIPEWTYDKVLYVEKAGVGPALAAAGLAERYDMAVVLGQGYPVEACRELFARAEGQEFRLFVLHDADPAGFNIARTLAEDTERMPDHSVELVDLGLTVTRPSRPGWPGKSSIGPRRCPGGSSRTCPRPPGSGSRARTQDV